MDIKDIPKDFNTLNSIFPICEIIKDSEYNKAMDITRKISLIEFKSIGQEEYLSKLIDYIIPYEDKHSYFK